MEDINKTQPRKLAIANKENIHVGDLYIATREKWKFEQTVGVVVYVGKEGFSCLYNHVDQDKKELLKFVTDEKYCERHSTQYDFDNLNEGGFFMRRQEDGKLELIATRHGFLEDLEILEDMHQKFLEEVKKSSSK